MFRCGNNIWKGNYDADSRRFVGFRKFMRYNRVIFWNMIIFDYYGDKKFKVRLFKPNAIESDPLTYDVKEFMTNDNFRAWNQDEFIFDGTTLEFEKTCGLWAFNAYMNYSEYYSMKFIDLTLMQEFINWYHSLCALFYALSFEYLCL